MIDWHNLGYTMFPEERGWLRWGVRGLEREVGRRFGGFCVSEGMKRFLREEMDVNVEVRLCYDYVDLITFYLLTRKYCFRFCTIVRRLTLNLRV